MQHCWILYVHCCVRLHTMLHVVGSCCAKFETSQTFSYMQTDALTQNDAENNLLNLIHSMG